MNTARLDLEVARFWKADCSLQCIGTVRCTLYPTIPVLGLGFRVQGLAKNPMYWQQQI